MERQWAFRTVKADLIKVPSVSFVTALSGMQPWWSCLLPISGWLLVFVHAHFPHLKARTTFADRLDRDRTKRASARFG